MYKRNPEPKPAFVGGPAAGRMTGFDIEVYYDGRCPLCMREILLIQRLDRRGRIAFADIADESFDPNAAGLTRQKLMDRIHGRLPDGTIIEGVEVFRRLYMAVGFGPLVALTRLPGIAQLLDIAYRVFAKNRLWLTGRYRNEVCQLAAKQSAEKARRP